MSVSKQCQPLAIFKNFDKKLRINLLPKNRHKASESFLGTKPGDSTNKDSFWANTTLLAENIYSAKFFGSTFLPVGD